LGLRFDLPDLQVGNVKDIDYDHLADSFGLVGRKLNFVLLIADVTTDCTCFAKFRSSITSYIQSSTLSFIRSIPPNSKTKTPYGAQSFPPARLSESIAIFENGAVKYQRQRAGEADTWSTNADTFKTWMNARVSVPTCFILMFCNSRNSSPIPPSSRERPRRHRLLPRPLPRLQLTSRITSSRTYNLTTHAESYVIDCDVPGLHDPKDGTTASTTESKAQWTLSKRSNMASPRAAIRNSDSTRAMSPPSNSGGPIA
jgi:hypothetical protein